MIGVAIYSRNFVSFLPQTFISPSNHSFLLLELPYLAFSVGRTLTNGTIPYNYPLTGWWIDTETWSIEVYLHRSSLTLRGIVMFQYLPNQMDKKMPLHQWPQFLLLKLSRSDAQFSLRSQNTEYPRNLIPSNGSQSKRVKIAIHWFGKYCIYIASCVAIIRQLSLPDDCCLMIASHDAWNSEWWINDQLT